MNVLPGLSYRPILPPSAQAFQTQAAIFGPVQNRATPPNLFDRAVSSGPVHPKPHGQTSLPVPPGPWISRLIFIEAGRFGFRNGAPTVPNKVCQCHCMTANNGPGVLPRAGEPDVQIATVRSAPAQSDTERFGGSGICSYYLLGALRMAEHRDKRTARPVLESGFMRTFRISDELYEQLKRFIVDPFDDTPEVVIGRLVEIVDKARSRWSPFDVDDSSEEPSQPTEVQQERPAPRHAAQEVIL
jgi:hypothetical protein